MKFKLKFLNIQYGTGCSFYGLTYLFEQDESQIIIGKNVTFRSSENSNLIGINRKCSFSTLRKGSKIVIGDGCGFSGTIIGAFTQIELGKNVRCGANTLITDSDWHDDDPRAGLSKPVRVCDNVWIGVNAIILKGVTIGENTIIGAGSIVTTNIPANVIAAGNPCKVIKPIDVKILQKLKT